MKWSPAIHTVYSKKGTDGSRTRPKVSRGGYRKTLFDADADLSPLMRPRFTTLTPTLTGLNPNSGTAGTTVSGVMLTGWNFDSSLTVSAGVIQVNNVVVVDQGDATADFIIPSGASGSVDVTVTTAAGVSNPPLQFTINAPQPVACPDHVTGGGFMKPRTAQHIFGFAGGFQNGQPWGSMEFDDDDTGRKVHGTEVDDCQKVDDDTCEIHGKADVDGQSGSQCGPFKFITRVVAENGPGGRSAAFFITVFDDCGVVVENDGDPSGSTPVDGGHIEVDP